MSLPLIGGTRALIKCANYQEEEAEEDGRYGRSSRLWAVGLEEQKEEGGGHRRTRTVIKTGAVGWRRSDRVKQDFLHPTARHCFHDRTKKFFFRFRISPPRHHTLTSKIYPVFRFTKFSFLRCSRVSNMLIPDLLKWSGMPWSNTKGTVYRAELVWDGEIEMWKTEQQKEDPTTGSQRQKATRPKLPRPRATP